MPLDGIVTGFLDFLESGQIFKLFLHFPLSERKLAAEISKPGWRKIQIISVR